MSTSKLAASYEPVAPFRGFNHRVHDGIQLGNGRGGGNRVAERIHLG